jgi:hypothetical protein
VGMRTGKEEIGLVKASKDVIMGDSRLVLFRVKF